MPRKTRIDLGGRETAIGSNVPDQELRRMNEAPTEAPVNIEAALGAVNKITPADIDKAMEAALSRWQASGRLGPMPMSKLFAARARQLGWVEDVEFVEER